MNVLHKQSMPGHELDNHIRLSIGLCAVHFEITCVDDADGWAEVARGRRSVRGQEVGSEREFQNMIQLEQLDESRKPSQRFGRKLLK